MTCSKCGQPLYQKNRPDEENLIVVVTLAIATPGGGYDRIEDQDIYCSKCPVPL